MSEFLFQEDVSIVLCGEAGQGIQTVESILIQSVKLGGYHVCFTKDAISKGAIDHLKERVSNDTIIIGDDETLKLVEKEDVIKIPFLKTAEYIGGPIFANVIAAGAISRILNIDKEIFNECITAMFERKGEKILKGDLKAGEEGYKVGENILKSGKIKIEIEKNPKIRDELLLDGTEVVGMGCGDENIFSGRRSIRRTF